MARPTITVPPRGSMDAIFTGGWGFGFSPDPMTMVSSLFSEQGPFSFSQLLAGAVVSPLPKLDGTGKGTDVGGYKKNRPENIVVPQPPPPTEPQSFSPLFLFTPGLSPAFLNSPGFLSPFQRPFGMSHQQALAHVTAQAASSQSYMPTEFEDQSSISAAEAVAEPSSALCDTSTEMDSLPTESEMESCEIFLTDIKSVSIPGDKPAIDGYKWRKYGQKHVKASECPRSYYKCTHLNCSVKKKVERSSEGCVTEITYKGQHNHDPPLPKKRGKGGMASDGENNIHTQPDLASQSQDRCCRFNDSAAVQSEPENSQTISSVDDLDRVIDVYHADDEPHAKRRNMDMVPSSSASSHHTVTETKVVVQTRSEVDLLDDGYRWRKYGQKLVKGNTHPRSYYRCTFSGCNVRKHVERASADPKAVITTYEGKHNHEIPVGKYSSCAPSSNKKKLKTQLEKSLFLGNNHVPATLQLKEEYIAAS